MESAVYASSAVGREQWNNNALRAVVSRRLSVRTHKQTYSGVDKAPSMQFNATLKGVLLTRARHAFKINILFETVFGVGMTESRSE